MPDNKLVDAIQSIKAKPTQPNLQQLDLIVEAFNNIQTHYDDLKLLFDDDTWMHIRYRMAGNSYGDFIHDVMKMWRQGAYERALAAIKDCNPTLGVVDCIQFALIRMSVNPVNQFADIDLLYCNPERMRFAVSSGVWTQEQALSVIDELADPQLQVEMITNLLTLEELSDSVQTKMIEVGLKAATGIADNRRRCRAYLMLLDHLEGQERQAVLELAEQTARDITDEGYRVKVFLSLSDRADGNKKEQLFTEARDMAVKITHPTRRISALYESVRRLTGDSKEEILQLVFEAIKALESSLSKAQHIVMIILPHAKGKLLEEAVEVGTQAARAVFASELQYLYDFVEFQDTETRQEIISYLAGIAERRGDAGDLGRLAAMTDGPLQQILLDKAIEAAMTVEKGNSRVWALYNLADRFDEPISETIKQKAIDIAFALTNDAELLTDKVELAWLYSTIAEITTGSIRQIAIQQGIETALEIPDAWDSIRVLWSFTDYEDFLPTVTGHLRRIYLDSLLNITHWSRYELLDDLHEDGIYPIFTPDERQTLIKFTADLCWKWHWPEASQ